jgi:hypothetical protein
MLVGFFTYKFAVVGRQGLQLLTDISNDISGKGREEGGSSGGGSGEEEGGAMTLDRIFVKKVWSE